MTAAVVTLFAAALAISLSAVAEEVRPSLKGATLMYSACVAQHPKDFRVACAERRRAFKVETMARHGYVDETIGDPPRYCRAQVVGQIQQLGKVLKEDPQLLAMVRTGYRTMYSDCLRAVVKRNSDPEMLKNRKLNEDNAECIAQTAENVAFGRTRTPNEFYIQCMSAFGWSGYWLE